MNEKDKHFNKKTKRLINLLLIISLLFVIASFIAPYFVTTYSIIDLSNKGSIGDALGGIMNPFIAIAGVVLTYLAFYMQYKSNIIQIKQFNDQLKDRENELKIEKKEKESLRYKENFERQFYQMLAIHSANVKEMNLESKKANNQNLSGRNVFKYVLDELITVKQILQKIGGDVDSPEDLIKESYWLVFDGLDQQLWNFDEDSYDLLLQIKNYFNSLELTAINRIFPNYIDDFKVAPQYELYHKILNGYSSLFGHYYRHLYQTVKFVANQDESLISYEEKRKFLRLLRSQLSNEEQLLLFYNWLSAYGSEWEGETNHFFTDYRMIHNIPSHKIFNELDLESYFDFDYRKRSSDDLLFEYQT